MRAYVEVPSIEFIPSKRQKLVNSSTLDMYLKQDVSIPQNEFWKGSFGDKYPILKKMARDYPCNPTMLPINSGSKSKEVTENFKYRKILET